jgi:D-xylulose reductase
MAVAKALGASRIIAVDILESRLRFAKGYAATEVYLPLSLGDEESKVRYAKRNASHMKTALDIEDYGPRAIDLVIEAR